MWTALLEAEGFAAKLRAKIIGPGKAGRPPGAASAEDRKPAQPERVKLLVVRSENAETPISV